MRRPLPPGLLPSGLRWYRDWSSTPESTLWGVAPPVGESAEGGDGAIVCERNWTWLEGSGGVVKDEEVLERESAKLVKGSTLAF